MKRMKYLFLAIAALGLGSCSDFDELNTNPNRSTNMDPQLMIPTIQMRQSENNQEWARYLAYPGGWMNHWCGDWGMIEYGGRGIKYASYEGQMWISYYPIIIRDVVDVIERTRDVEDKVNLHSVARILRVQAFQKMTDMYGDIPYSEAGEGYYKDIIMPKYDTQEFIYTDMLKELTEAAEALDTAGDAITYDQYFGGDIEKWRRYANSMRLRLAMRLTKVDPAKAKSEAEAAVAAGVMTSNSDICYIVHENEAYNTEGVGRSNGIAMRLSSPDTGAGEFPGFHISKELVRTMENIGDPRITWVAGSYLIDPARTDITEIVKNTAFVEGGSYTNMALPAQMWPWDSFADPAMELTWVGNVVFNVNGRDVELTNGQWRLRPSKLVTDPASPYVHQSFAEVSFLMAEMAQRGWNTGGKTAGELYTQGLDAAVRQWSLFGADVAAKESQIARFLSQNTLTPGREMMEINTQLWVLHMLDPIEAWSNWRRTGMPDLVFKNIEPSRNQSNGVQPRRLEYPIEEQMKNGANYKDALSRQGGIDSWNNRVWWDKE